MVYHSTTRARKSSSRYGYGPSNSSAGAPSIVTDHATRGSAVTPAGRRSTTSNWCPSCSNDMRCSVIGGSPWLICATIRICESCAADRERNERCNRVGWGVEGGGLLSGSVASGVCNTHHSPPTTHHSPLTTHHSPL